MVAGRGAADDDLARWRHRDRRVARRAQPRAGGAGAVGSGLGRRLAGPALRGRFVDPAVDPQRGAVEVKLRVPHPPDTLRQDMTVSVDIEVGRRGGALVVPAAAVNDAAGPRPWRAGSADGGAARAAPGPARRPHRGGRGAFGGRPGHPLSGGAAARGRRVRVVRGEQPLAAFEWIAAFRFLMEGRMQSAFILGGVAIGVGVIVFMSALLSGCRRTSQSASCPRRSHQCHRARGGRASAARGRAGHADAVDGAAADAAARSLDQWQSVVAAIARRPDVAEVSPVAAGSALAVRGEASRSVTLTGIDPESYFRRSSGCPTTSSPAGRGSAPTTSWSASSSRASSG